MTGREFIESGGDPAGLGLPARDWDRLADYVGGALEGTPEEAEVARRVADDPAWGRAYTALTAATAEVSADLSAWGQTAAAMPEDVAARLSAALADAGPAALPSRVTPPPRLSEKRARGGLSVVPDLPGEPARPPQPARVAARPHRWIKWATPVAVAAAVLGVVGLGINALLPTENSGAPTSLNGDGARDSEASEDSTAGAAGPQSLAGIPVQRLIASGTDYRPGTLAAADRAARNLSSMSTDRPEIPRQDTPGPVKGQPPATAPELVGTVDPALQRLKATPTLADCLRAVEAQHQRAAARVDLVDYATFEGSAALVIVFTDVSGQRMVWVSGPNCGVAGDANTLHSTRVG